MPPTCHLTAFVPRFYPSPPVGMKVTSHFMSSVILPLPPSSQPTPSNSLFNLSTLPRPWLRPPASLLGSTEDFWTGTPTPSFAHLQSLLYKVANSIILEPKCDYVTSLLKYFRGPSRYCPFSSGPGIPLQLHLKPLLLPSSSLKPQWWWSTCSFSNKWSHLLLLHLCTQRSFLPNSFLHPIHYHLAWLTSLSSHLCLDVTMGSLP